MPGLVEHLKGFVSIGGAQSVNDKLADMRSSFRQAEASIANMRAALLFASFGLMAAGQILKQFTDPLVELREQFEETYKAIEFQAMSVSTILTGTGEVVGDVTEQMLEYGRDTEWTAKEAGEAMEYLARAGFDVQTAMEGTGVVLDLATATTLNTKQAADVLSGSLLGWSQGAVDATTATSELSMHATELMMSAHSARQEVSDMAQALKYATAAAQTVGWEFENVAGAISLAANNMVRAGIAGRAMRRMMTRLARISGTTSAGINQAKNTLRKYNIELTDAHGNLKSLPEVIGELEEATADLTKTQKANLYAQLAGMRGMNTMSILVSEGQDKLEKYALTLSAAAAKERILQKEGGNVAKRLKQLRERARRNAEGTQRFANQMSYLTNELGYNKEEAKKINSVITDTAVSTEEWNDAIKKAHSLSKVTKSRLETLEGTMILLNSSVEALHASYGKQLAPILKFVYQLFRNLADIISGFPGWLKTIIAVLVLVIAVFSQIGYKLIMTYGMLMMAKAAWVSYKLEMDEVNKENVKMLTMTDMVRDSLGGLKNTLHLTAMTAVSAAVSIGLLVMSTQMFTKEGYKATKSQRRMRQMMVILIPVIMTASQVLSYLTSVEIFNMYISAMLRQAYNNLAISIGSVLGIAFSLFLLYKLLGKWGKYLIPIIYGIIGAVYALSSAFSTTPLGWLIYALSGIATLILIITDYIWGWTDSIYGTEDALIGNSLIPVLQTFKDILGLGADALEWISNKLSFFGEIVSYVEKGIQSMTKWVNDLIQSIVGAGDWLKWLGKVSDKMIGHSVIPENFERGVGRIQNALGQLEDTNFAMKAGISEEEATKVVGSPRISVDMRNMKVEEPLSADQISDIVKQASDESLDKWKKEVKRTI